MPLTITEFLEARIADDEDLADRSIQLGDKGASLVSFGSKDSPPILVLHPDRILAECAAKRAILVQEFQHLEVIDGEWGCAHYAEDIRKGACAYFPLNGMHERLSLHRALAAVYASHPDYQQEWAL